MATNDEEVTLSQLAAAIGCSKNTASTWVRAGMPLLRRGGRGRGNHTTVSLKAACAWLIERPVMLFQSNDFSLIASIEYQAAAERILRRLDRAR